MKIAKKILIILSFLASSGCGTKYINVHKELVLEPSCPYTEVSEDQKAYLKKEPDWTIAFLIEKNKEDCESREITNQEILDEHNKCHGEEGC